MKNLYIANAFDKPCHKLIAKLEGGFLHYIHPSLKDYGPVFYAEDQAELVEDFGIKIETETLSSGQIILRGEKVKDSVVTYSDGKIREWQGSSSFSFCL